MNTTATLFPELFAVDQVNHLVKTKVAEVKLTYSTTVKPSDMPRITCSNDAFRLLSEYWKDDSEYIERFYVLLLNQANKVIAISMISQGGISGTVADPRVIFTVALKTAAAAIILAHNHPSGNCKPSDADIKLTHKMQNAGSFLDIPVLDHVIIGDGNYYSFADEGII